MNGSPCKISGKYAHWSTKRNVLLYAQNVMLNAVTLIEANVIFADIQNLSLSRHEHVPAWQASKTIADIFTFKTKWHFFWMASVI